MTAAEFPWLQPLVADAAVARMLVTVSTVRPGGVDRFFRDVRQARVSLLRQLAKEWLAAKFHPRLQPEWDDSWPERSWWEVGPLSGRHAAAGVCILAGGTEMVVGRKPQPAPGTKRLN